jgi:hypothetical protein
MTGVELETTIFMGQVEQAEASKQDENATSISSSFDKKPAAVDVVDDHELSSCDKKPAAKTDIGGDKSS